jgi:hypothetical protein
MQARSLQCLGESKPWTDDGRLPGAGNNLFHRREVRRDALPGRNRKIRDNWLTRRGIAVAVPGRGNRLIEKPDLPLSPAAISGTRGSEGKPLVSTETHDHRNPGEQRTRDVRSFSPIAEVVTNRQNHDRQ